MKIARKLKGHGGFTLAETMLAVLILLLVSSIVATGVPAAKDAYEKVILGSNAQLLLSTTVNALRDELGTAWEVSADGASVTYFSADTGTKSVISKGDKTILRQEFAHESADATNFIFGDKISSTDTTIKYGSTGISLVSDMTTTNDLYVTYDSVSCDKDKDIVTFTGLKVYRKTTESDTVPLADMGDDASTLVIRVFSTAE